MKGLFLISLATGVLASGALLLAQDRGPTRSDNPTQARTDQTRTSSDGTLARVKEFTPGKKIVLDVDNAPDKSYDLADRNTTVQVPSSLKVGDAVKVTERTVNGKKMVDIAPDSESGAKHGDQPPARR